MPGNTNYFLLDVVMTVQISKSNSSNALNEQDLCKAQINALFIKTGLGFQNL